MENDTTTTRGNNMTQKTLHLTLTSLANAWTGVDIPGLGLYVPLQKVSSKLQWAQECSYLYALSIIAASDRITNNSLAR